MTDVAKHVFNPSDPDNVPVKIIDMFAGLGPINGLVALTLVTNRLGPLGDGGKTDNDFVVAARLRMTVDVAKVIRDQLNAQIALLEAPKGEAN